MRIWADGLIEQWGGDPLVEDAQKLRTLLAFCEHCERTPDELVAFCYLRKRTTGERFVSRKRRGQVAAELRDFLATRGASGLDGRRLSAAVLSFLIHNGVMMHTGMV
ncbi:MAG: hypothetical protein RIC56_17430 [Pseudomonadales bacterium]